MSTGGAQHKVLGPFFSAAGVLYPSIKVYIYAAGTLTTKTAWSDEAKTTALAQPFIADTSGIARFFADGDYKFLIKDTNDNTLYTWDNIKVTSDEALMWEAAEGTAYPSATATNRWQLFLKRDGSNVFQEIGASDGATFVNIIGSKLLAYINSLPFNVALGDTALDSNVTGIDNVAIGRNALSANTVANRNVAVGKGALAAATGSINADENTAVGNDALGNLTSGYSNAVLGTNAGALITTGFKNSLIGHQAGQKLLTGQENVMVGQVSGIELTTGSGNTLVGKGAGYRGDAVTALTTGNNNTFIGFNSGKKDTSQISRAVAIGYNAIVTGNDQIVLGDYGNPAHKVGIGTNDPTLAKLQVEFGSTDGIMARNTSANGVSIFTLKNPTRQWEIALRGDSLDDFAIENAQAATRPFKITTGDRVKIANVARLHLPIIAAGSLPAAGSVEDGSILIEDVSSDNRNLILYAGGERFRIDGGLGI